MIKSDISVELIDHMGSHSSVVRAARVSFAGDNKEFDQVKDSKLIQYLAKHQHISPFHHTFISVKVKAPVFVARQLVKHEYMPWNEESRRYIRSEPEFYIPIEWRKAAENVKQGSSDELVTQTRLTIGWEKDEDGDTIANSFEYCPETPENAVYWHCVHSLHLYEDLIASGVCNEQARMVLPQNMMVNWYWSGTLSAMAKMLRLRLDGHTQKESREVAEKIRELVEPLFPVSLPALLGENK